MVWASKTDYASLYTADYFGKHTGIASFDVNKFPVELSKLCANLSCNNVVDVGSGSGVLAESLHELGLQVFACDYDPAHSDAIHIDLSAQDGRIADAARQEICRRTNSNDYLVTCFDVLEHIDVEDVASAVSNLRRITGDLAVVSISTRPSSRDNAYHATVVPLGTWQEILTAAGFAIIKDGLFKDTQHVLSQDIQSPDLALVAHWARVDPFRDRLEGEPRYLLLRAVRPLDSDHVQDTSAKLLDVAYRQSKREQFGSAATEKRIGLNIHSIQDFLNLRPLMDVLKRDSTVGFVRPNSLRPDELSLVRGAFRRFGVMLIEVEVAGEIPWPQLKLDVLISSAESSVSTTHILSRQLVEAAKMNGVFTVLLQHGIWVNPIHDRVVSSASDVVLSWGSEHGDFFISGHSVAGTAATAGLFPGDTFRAVGGPKFSDLVIAPQPDVLRTRLGIDVRKFRNVALLGTNLNWFAHGVDRNRVAEYLARAIKANPDIFFVLKTHPTERAGDYSSLSFDNVLVVDDIVLGSMDLPIARLINGVDLVVSSLSTLLLDAAIAGKPFIQYETENEYSYRFCTPTPLEALADHLKDRSRWYSADAEMFRRHYADAEDGRFYQRLAEVLVSPYERTAANAPAAVTYSLAAQVEQLWNSLYQERHAFEAEFQRITNDAETRLAQQAHHLAAVAEERLAQQAHHLAAVAEERLTEQRNHLEAEAHHQLGKQQQDLLGEVARIEARCQERVERMTKRIATLEGRILRKDAELRTAFESLEAFKRSTSWRITAPMRALLRFVR